MSKRFVSWGIPARERTEEEIALDRRLEAQARALAGEAISKDEWVRSQYRAMSRAGATKAEFERRYTHGDMQIMDAHVDQMFWQMVRHQLRTNPNFVKQLEFIESFYEVPQHEFLERIKKRYWAQMQLWTDDRKHLGFLQEVFRAWHAAKLQIYDDDPAHDVRRQLEEDARRAAARSRADALADAWREPSDLEMAQWLRELGQ